MSQRLIGWSIILTSLVVGVATHMIPERRVPKGPTSILHDGKEGMVLLADRRLFLLDREVKVHTEMVLEGLEPTEDVTRVALHHDHLLVATSAGRVQSYSREGQLLGSFRLEGRFRCTVLSASEHYLYAADACSAGFSIHDTTGRHHRTMNGPRLDVLTHVPGINEMVTVEHVSRRLVAHDIEGRELRSWKLPSTNGCDARELVASPNGELAVLEHCRDGSAITTVSPERGVVRRVKLAGAVDPLSFLIRQQDLLVLDDRRMTILRYSHDGRALGTVVDAKLEEYLAPLRIARPRIDLRNWLRATVPMLALLVALVGVTLLTWHHTPIGPKHPLFGRLELEPLPAIDETRRRSRRRTNIAAGGLFCAVMSFAIVSGANPVWWVVAWTSAILVVVVAGRRAIREQQFRAVSQRFLTRHAKTIDGLLAPREKIRLAAAGRPSAHSEYGMTLGHVQLLCTDRRVLILGQRFWSPGRAEVLDDIPLERVTRVARGSLNPLVDKFYGDSFVRFERAGTLRPIELALASEGESLGFTELVKKESGRLSLAAADPGGELSPPPADEGAISSVERE